MTPLYASSHVECPCVEVDTNVDAAYMYLVDGRIAHAEEVAPGIIVDYDSSGNALGIEFLHSAAVGLFKHLSDQLIDLMQS